MKLFFSIYLLLIGLFSFSQFNVIVEDSTRNHIYSCLIYNNDSSIIIQNGTGDSIGTRGISYIKTNLNGEIIWQKFYSNYPEYWWEGRKHSIVKSGNNYIASGIIQDSIERPFILKFTNEFDTIFTKRIFNDTIIRNVFSITKSYILVPES